MSLATRLLESLQQSAQRLEERRDLVETLGLCSVTLVGSLSREDFTEGGSDVDLLVVHRLDTSAVPKRDAPGPWRALAQHFGEPLQTLGGAGGPKTFPIDCHAIEAAILAGQPTWADPARFGPEQLANDPYLWLYAFDLVEHARTLWGDPPAPALHAFEPTAYLPLVARQLREDLARLEAALPAEGLARQATARGFTGGPPLDGLGMPRLETGKPARVSTVDWKRLAGQVVTSLALQHGARNLTKREVYRIFSLRVPYFPGKDFGGAIWSEYVHGIVYHEPEEWIRRCHRLCDNGLKLLDAG